MNQLRIGLAGILLTSAACMAAEIWSSPNGRFECASALGRQRHGQELWLRVPAVPESRTLVWASERWMEASWSPDSSCLAVVDHFEPDEAAVLIFVVRWDAKAGRISTALVFESPLKDRRKQEWAVKDWDLKKGQVLLVKREGARKSTVMALLSDRPIEQSIYTRDPRGPPAEPQKEMTDGSRRKS